MRHPSPLSLALLAAVACALPATPAPASPRPMTVHDLVAMNRISEPQVSPDGGQVVYVLRETDLAANRGRTDLWSVPAAGGSPRRLTRSPASESSPRFAPDGESLYFLSSRSGSSQVWRLPLGGGEAEPVTELPVDVGSFALSPDGGLLAVALRVFPGCGSLACTAEKLAAREQELATGRAYDRLFVRHWDSWGDGLKSQLFVSALGGAGGKEPVSLSGSLDADVPSTPFGGAEEYTFSPDGREVIFTARIAGGSEPWSTNFDLYAVPADASAPPRNLTAANPAWDTQPTFSPDGKTLAWLAMARPGYEADRFRIVLKPWPEGEPRVLTEGWDRSPEGIAFSPDGATLYTVADDHGNQGLFAIEVATGKVRRLVGTGQVTSPLPLAGRLVFALESLGAPVDLHTSALDGSGLRPLTAVNRERLGEIEMGAFESFTFPGWNGEEVQAWVVKPAGFAAGKTYPLAFLIHGGPQGAFGNSFHYRWNPQVYAGAGYAAVMVNFHGSTGFGQGFTDAIRGDWGGKPLEDLQLGLAAALARYPWIDGGRVCALGASYGGYMVNWIAGTWAAEEPAPFRCLVNHDGVFDQRMMYYATEELWFPEWEHGGPYYENPEGHERHNPASLVARWRTPMLVIHGALDYRIPESQGLGAFTALQRRGVPSRFLFFPDENHWVVAPANSVLWHQEVLAWLGRWTGGE